MSATKVTPSPSDPADASRPPAQTAKRKRMRRLSFADEYDGGKLEDTVHCNNLHYSKEQKPKPASSGGGAGGGGGSQQQSDEGGGGCCVIS